MPNTIKTTISLLITFFMFVMCTSKSDKSNFVESGQNNDSTSIDTLKDAVKPFPTTKDSLLSVFVELSNKYSENENENNLRFETLASEAVQIYLTENNIRIDSTSEVKQYKSLVGMMEKIFPNLDTIPTQYQINQAAWINTLKDRYLVLHYQKKLYELPAFSGLQKQCLAETDAWYNYQNSQFNFFNDVIQEGTGGSSYPHVMANYFSKIYNDRLENILELYFTLNDKTYEKIKGQYVKLNNELFDNEYTLYQKAILKGDNTGASQYTAKEKIQMLNNAKQKWIDFLKSRETLSSELSGKLKTTFDKSTWRYQKRHLVDMKNGYNTYEFLPSSSYEMLLKDDCSYKKLINFSNPFDGPTIYVMED